MPIDLILGTAGHIDHGKTSLVKALTGIDCDRLPEEKTRGITIDIGFAHLEIGNYRLGIVDVPGHERFIRNMLAGATGIDMAILVVAADDSVMPQTREHLEILRLLGLRVGVIVLTKGDLVDDMTREVVELEIRELVRGTFLAEAPIITTYAHTGEGIAELRATLERLCGTFEDREATQLTRLPIDRAFVIEGHGTVATGSIVSGRIEIGDELEWFREDGSSERVRVRGLNNHGRAVGSVHRGQRAAINLAGVAHDRVHRGQELATPGYLTPSKVLTVRLRCSRDTSRPIKHRLSARLHVGTAEILATIALLDCDQIAPGTSGLAQLFLTEPATSVWGQAFVLRDASAEHTLGGGQILQPVAKKIRRRHLEPLLQIEQLQADSMASRVLAATWLAGFRGLQHANLPRETGILPDAIDAMIVELLASGGLVELSLPRKLFLHKDRFLEIQMRILELLALFHEQNPLMTSHDRKKILAQLDYIRDEALLQTTIEYLLKARLLVGDTRRIARADFKPKLSANQRKLKEKVIEAHAAAGLQPPEVKDFVNQAAGNAGGLRDIFEVAVAEGFLVRISEEIYLHSDNEVAMREQIEERLRESSGLTVAEIRDLLGTTRKFAVPICEYLDRIGLTRRVGDLRVLAVVM